MATELDEGYSFKSNPFVKSKRGGVKGNKGNKDGSSKSVLKGGPKRGREHLCWGTNCDADATRLAGLKQRDVEKAKTEPVAFVPLCQSCAGKVSRRAEKKNLPAPNITPMTLSVSEAYKGQVDDTPSLDANSAVEALIKSKRAESDQIHKKQKQQPGGRYVKAPRSGNPNLGGKPVFKNIADIRRREEAEDLTLRVIRGDFHSLKNRN
jgi:hypothetical protein